MPMAKSTPRSKMDEPQVSRLILDIITTEDPKEKARLKALNRPTPKNQKRESKKKQSSKARTKKEGKARAAKLSPKRRSEIARISAKKKITKK